MLENHNYDKHFREFMLPDVMELWEQSGNRDLFERDISDLIWAVPFGVTLAQSLSLAAAWVI